MKILHLHLQEGFFYRDINFTERTLFFSKENSQGKTTLMRLILFALGFKVPSIAGINFYEVSTNISILVQNNEILINRVGDSIQYSKEGTKLSFILPNDESKLHALIFGFEELLLLQNVLGAMYVDQTRGPVVLNRGDIIGNNNFTIEKFIAGLQGTDIDQLTNEVIKEQKSLRDYKSIQAIAEYKVENNLENIDEPHSLEEEEINYVQAITLLTNRFRSIKRKIDEIKAAISENTSFMNVIEGYRLFVTDSRGEAIKVNAESINGFTDNRDLLSAQLQLLNIEKNTIEKDIKQLKQFRQGDNKLIDVTEVKNVIDQKLKGIVLDYQKINAIVEQSKAKIRDLKRTIKDKITSNSTIVDYINKVMFSCAERLGVIKCIEKNGIFTSKIQNKSGAQAYRVIISFRIAFIKAVSMY
jgi:hypothetical protein